MENDNIISRHIIACDHPVVDYWKKIFESLESHPDSRLRVMVRPSDITRKAPALIQQLLLALQHSPPIIGQLIKGIQVDFAKEETGNDYYMLEEWTRPIFGKWFLHLAKLFPGTVYFFSEPLARYLSLAGNDVFYNNTDADKLSKHTLSYREGQQQVMSKRLFTASCFFGKFCYSSGVNPDGHISALINEFNPAFSLQDVKDAYMYLYRNQKKNEDNHLFAEV